MNNLHLALNILGTEHIFVLFTALYINVRTDAKKLCPLYEIISGDNAIIEMWANHFEKLGLPGSHPTFNDNFRDTIEHEIKMILTECIETPTAMEGLFVYETVKEVCTNLKSGVSGGLDQVTYEYLKYGGPKLWSILSILYFRVSFD